MANLNRKLFVIICFVFLTTITMVHSVDAYYSISGVVTTEDNVPIEGIDVRARPTTSGWIRTGTTRSDGTYTVYNLSDDLSYRVEARTPDESQYVDEYYPNSLFYSDATSININSTGPINFQLALGGTIAGQVTSESTGAGLEGVSIDPTLYYDEYNSIGLGNVFTDSNGNYVISGLPAGIYKLRATDYNERKYVAEYYDNTYDSSQASSFQVSSGLETTINFQLAEGATISGTVTAKDTGLPLENIYVNANHTRGYSYGGDSTDANGNYVITGLAPGDYRIQAEGSDTYAGEYYDDKNTYNEANLVNVVSGSNITQINIPLTLGGFISGTVIAEDTGFPISGASLQVYHVSGYSSKNGYTDENGRFIIGGLFPGEYTVQVLSDPPYAGEFYANTYSPVEAGHITVNSGQVSGFIDFALARTGSISGIIYSNETGQPLQGVGIGAFPVDYQTSYPYSTLSGVDGRYLIENVPPGDYKVYSSGNGMSRNCYGQNEICDSVSVNSGLTKGFIDIYLDRGALLSVLVTNEDGLPLSGIFVRILDSTLPDWYQSYSWNQTDSNGYYSFDGLKTFDDYKLLINYAPPLTHNNYSYVLLPDISLTAPESYEQKISLDYKSDSDNDSLHDQWEAILGLDTDADDSFEDSDGDGYCNLQEFLNATDPLDPFSTPKSFRETDNDDDLDGIEMLTIIKELDNNCDPENSFCMYDLDWDGDVDDIDLRLFAEYFGLTESNN